MLTNVSPDMHSFLGVKYSGSRMFVNVAFRAPRIKMYGKKVIRFY